MLRPTGGYGGHTCSHECHALGLAATVQRSVQWCSPLGSTVGRRRSYADCVVGAANVTCPISGVSFATTAAGALRGAFGAATDAVGAGATGTADAASCGSSRSWRGFRPLRRGGTRAQALPKSSTWHGPHGVCASHARCRRYHRHDRHRARPRVRRRRNTRGAAAVAHVRDSVCRQCAASAHASIHARSLPCAAWHRLPPQSRVRTWPARVGRLFVRERGRAGVCVRVEPHTSELTQTLRQRACVCARVHDRTKSAGAIGADESPTVVRSCRDVCCAVCAARPSCRPAPGTPVQPPGPL